MEINVIWMIAPILLAVYFHMFGTFTKQKINKLDKLPSLMTGILVCAVIFMPFIHVWNIFELPHMLIVFWILVGISIPLLVYFMDWKNYQVNMYVIIAVPALIILSYIYHTIDDSNIGIHYDQNVYGVLIKNGFNGLSFNYLGNNVWHHTGDAFVKLFPTYTVLTGYNFLGLWQGLFGNLFNYKLTIVPGGKDPAFQMFILILSTAFIADTLTTFVGMFKKQIHKLIWPLIYVGMTVGNNYSSGMIMSNFVGLYILVMFILYIKNELDWFTITFIFTCLFFWMTSIFMYLPLIALMMIMKNERMSFKQAMLLTATTVIYLLGSITVDSNGISGMMQPTASLLLPLYLIIYLFQNVIYSIMNWYKNLIVNTNIIKFIPLIFVAALATEMYVYQNDYEGFQFTLALTRGAYLIVYTFLFAYITMIKKVKHENIINWLCVSLLVLNPLTIYITQFEYNFSSIGHRWFAFAFTEEGFAIQNATTHIFAVTALFGLNVFFKYNPFDRDFINKLS